VPVEIPLSRVATIIRSKNAGPFRITLDIVFRDRDTYRKVTASRVITPETIIRRYGLGPGQLTNFVEFDPGNSIKATFKRTVSAGTVGDTDVYGTQQHAPLLDLMLPAAVLSVESGEASGDGTDRR
jgi:uncharacterized protein DUF4387